MISRRLLLAWLLAGGGAAVPGASGAAPPAGRAPVERAHGYGERQVAELLEIARSEKEPENRRAQAVRLLANTGLRSQMPALRKLLREERSLDIRLSAACSLVTLGDLDAPRDLLLATAYDGERTPNCSRSDVLTALGRLGDPAAELHLERALRQEPPEDEPSFHIAACRALAALDTAGARRILLRALREGGPGIRQAAVTPAAGLALDPKNPDRLLARQLLLLAARQDPDEAVAERAAVALFWAGVDGNGFYALLEKDPDPKVRARAARVLDRHYLSPPRLQRLREALERERDPEVRAAIRATLESQRAGATAPRGYPGSRAP